MTMTSVAKFSAIYMLVAVIAGTASAFWPAESGVSGRPTGIDTARIVLR